MTVRLWLCILLLAPTGVQAQTGITSTVKEWLTGVVAKVGAAENAKRPTRDKQRHLVVDLRIVIGADGALRDVTVERGSGSQATDESAVGAVRAAAPFEAPPKDLLTLEGIVDLSLPLELDRRR